MKTFDPEELVAECRAALLHDDPVTVVRDIVAAAVVEGAAIDAALGRENPTFPSALLASDELTVQRLTWWPGLRTLPHEHRMWAVVGVYDGVEVNDLFRRTPTGLEALSTHEVGAGEVIVLDETAVHAVENPLRARTAGIHVYGGPILTQERLAWGPDGRERPFDEQAELERTMFRTARELLAERGIDHDDGAKYTAMRALVSARAQLGRYLTDEEARRIVIDAWDTPGE